MSLPRKYDYHSYQAFIIWLLHCKYIIKPIQMQIDRNVGFLCSVDLKKIILNQSKKQIQSSNSIDFRSSVQRSASFQVSLNHSFAFETLITNVEVIWSNPNSMQTNFDNLQVEVSSLSSRGLYGQLINLKIDKQPSTYIFTGAGFTYCIKVNLWLKQDSKKKNSRINQKQFIENVQKLIGQTIKQINIYGVTINSNPSSILLTKLLNISQLFKKYNLLQQAAQTDILVALSLINARRFVLAAQILRKVSKFYVEKYNSSKSTLDVSRTQRSVMREIDEEVGYSTTRTNFGSGRTLEGNKFLQRAAKIELLIAQTVSHPSLVFQKLQAYHRCNAYACGNVSPSALYPDADLQQIALSVFPQIVGFLLKLLSDKLQPFRIAALKSIQFFIQTLGCSIGQSFLQILKQVINTYPSSFSPQINPNKIPYGLQEVEIASQKNPAETESGIPLIKNKILMDHYHHLLQTLLSLMGLINRKMIICAFTEIITPSILAKDASSELKLYLLRFAERSVSLSGADLVIQVSFIGLLLSLCQQKNVSKMFQSNNLSAQKSQSKGRQNLKKKHEGSATTQNKQIIHNLMHFSQKILASIKVKVLPRYSGPKMQSFLQWINKTLSYFGQNDMLSNSNSSHSLFVFTSILDFISVSYSVLKYDHSRLTHSPIQTILYFLNLAIYNQQNGLPFDKILDTFITLLKFHCKMDSNFQLDEEMISRILQKSRQHNLSLKELQILIKVLEVCEQHSHMMLQWLDIYLGCIPHSTYDETYKVFCIMLTKGIRNIEEYPQKQQLLKKIVKTMLDQYTVKGKAHQQAKQTLIDCLIKNNPQNILSLIKICLFENTEPKPQSYYSKRKPRASQKGKKDNEHRFDSKSYKIDYQMFLEKISLAQMILTTISSQKLQNQLYSELLNQKFVQKFFNYMKILVQSSSFKLKNKAISLINYFIEISRHSWKEKKFKIREFFLIIRNIFGITKTLVLKLKESKLLYSPLYNLISLYRCYEIEDGQGSIFQPQKIQKIYEEVEQKLKSQEDWNESIIDKNKGQRIINLLMLRQFIKIWPNLSLGLISSWENVRDIYTLLIVEVFKEGLFFIPLTLKKKIVDVTRALILNLFKSNEHNQRNAALKIFGTMIGLRATVENKDNFLGNMIKENLKYMKPFIEKVHDLTFDWDEKNVQISQNLCEICISEQTKCALNDRRTDKSCRKNPSMQHSYLSFNLEQQLNFQKKNTSLTSNVLDNQLLRQSWLFEQDLPISEQIHTPNITEELLNKIIQFRNLIDKDLQTKTEVFVQKQSFMEQNEEQFYDMGQEKAQSIEAKEKSQDDQLQFQDLGIIELDDEQWSQQQQKSEKAIQKLPLKKIYKLSPSVLNASKPQRIRSKRFHQNQFEYREKIIVDELEQKITNSQQISDSQNIANKPQAFQNQSNKVFQFNNQLIIKQKQTEKRQQKVEKIEKNEKIDRKQRIQYNKHNLVMQPLIIDDFDVRQQQRDQETHQQTRNRDKWQKQLKKQKQTQKQLYQIHSGRQRQMQKKPKKHSAKKRKASTGK